MSKNSLTISSGDFHFIQNMFHTYNVELKLINVKITQSNYSFSLLQLNRLSTQMCGLYQKLEFELKLYRDAELLLECCEKVFKKIVLEN